MNFLIVDDDDLDRLSIVRALKNSELEIDEIAEATSAQEAFQLTETHQFNMILLDFHLPGSSGIDTLHTLKRLSAGDTAIVIVSHNSDDQLALLCVDAGAQDFLLKSEISVMRLKRAILLVQERFKLEQALKQSYEKLRILAEQDSLTGLSNRYFFDETLKNLIHKAKRSNQNIGLLLLDLDKFKDVNDTLGHDAGDDLLRHVSRRLKQSTRDGDIICRLGGDEFAIIVSNMDSINSLRHLSSRIIKALSQPVFLVDKEISISASIGVATFPDCSSDSVELMKYADVAMYRAKTCGRNQTQYYSKEFHDEMERRIRLESDLKVALQRKQFELYYQPQIDSETGMLCGVESLVRWNHPDAGLILPSRFVEIAEESRLVNEIGKWVIESACKQFSKWSSQKMAKKITFSISANLSAVQLRDTGLVAYLQACIENYGISPDKLELELTESNLEKSLKAIHVLKELKELGVNLALDDFGTGYSSLSHLHQYPFNVLKIDKSFIQQSDKPEHNGFLKAVSIFAHSLGYETVAEGIETEAQMLRCKELGIKRLQGFYFDKAMPVEEFEKRWLE